MTLLTAFLINLISVVVGTFLGNLGLLLLIGKKAEVLERERIAQALAIRGKIEETIRKEQEKMKEYIKMES